jgi:hypothetical protein
VLIASSCLADPTCIRVEVEICFHLIVEPDMANQSILILDNLEIATDSTCKTIAEHVSISS